MAKFTISGVPEFNGIYEHDTGRLYDGDELHLIKKIAGVRLGEIEEAAESGDYDLVIAIAVIALIRSERIRLRDADKAAAVLRASSFGSILFEEEDESEVDEEVPLDQPQTTPIIESESSTSSSDSSNGTGALPENIPPPIGIPG